VVSGGGATGYELERDMTQSFAVPEAIYKGPLRYFNDASQFFGITKIVYYRVKATKNYGLSESAWSNVVAYKRPWKG
jgi:hypothetical protein